jgi:competence protein ComEA
MPHEAIDWAAVDAALDNVPPGHRPAPGQALPNGQPHRRLDAHWVWLTSAGLVALVILAGSAVLVASTPPPAIGFDQPGASSDPAPSTAALVLVDVEGAVRRPGLVRLPSGSRVADALAAAGGYSGAVDATAASTELDLADVLQDGAKVLVPQRGTAGGAAPAAAPHAGKVDLNRATAAELDALPGIGPVTAAKIIASRQQQPFRRVDDLRTRKLVGAATFAKLQALVTV